MDAEATRALIGNIILCAMGIAAAVWLLRKNWPRIKKICTDEDGKWDLIGGLERYFTHRGGQDEEEEKSEDTSPDEDFLELIMRQKGAGMADFDPEKEWIREHILFYGRVQGVGFRYQAMFAARNFDLTGWVENLSDGSVEMEVQGTPVGISKMMRHLKSGHWIRIDEVEMERRPLVRGERGFDVRGY